jgi:predicted exporter
MNFADALARLAIRRRESLIAATLLLCLASAVTLAFRLRVDTEILNLLPTGYPGVETLKRFNDRFAQTRELTFVLHDPSARADLDAVAARFAAALRAEPWVERAFERSPLEDPSAPADLGRLALPLLFNLPENEFAEALALLRDPAAPLARLEAELAAGSPAAELKARIDPVGAIPRALRPLAASFDLERLQPVASRDGTVRLVFALTRQHDAGPRACQATMDAVAKLTDRFLADLPEPRPEIVATGRTAYVAEMSRGMERDILSTVASSLLLITAIFWLHFRRFGALLALLHLLLIACVAAVAAGALLFSPLNGITVGLSSILLGLGVDFGVVLLGAYSAARSDGLPHGAALAAAARLAPGVAFGALTTAASFLALGFSGCPGFAQLGALIAFGILCAAGLSILVFPALLRDRPTPPHADPFTPLARATLALAARRPAACALAAGALLAGAAVFALAPYPPLRIAANPRALEPQRSEAGRALRLIQERMTESVSDPVVAMIDEPDPARRRAHWIAAQGHWSRLAADGTLRSAAAPGALALDPAQAERNLAALRATGGGPIEAKLRAALDASGFTPSAAAAPLALAAALDGAARDKELPATWEEALPPSSPWWFVIDRFLAPGGNPSVAYLAPSERLDSPERQAAFAAAVAVPGVPLALTGWSYTLAELIPWARSAPLTIGAIMVAANILLLSLHYRRVGPVTLMVTAIAGAVLAALGTIKALGIPITLFNALSFPLVLGVGVDYGLYVLLALRQPDATRRSVTAVLTAVLVSGLTSIAGFGSLLISYNPALAGLGTVAVAGIAWSLLATFGVVLPAQLALDARRGRLLPP